jgi:hypothetical protein
MGSSRQSYRYPRFDSWTHDRPLAPLAELRMTEDDLVLAWND